MNKSKLFTDAELAKMQEKRERQAKWFGEFVALEYLLDTSQKLLVNDNAPILALDHMKRLHKQIEETIFRINKEIDDAK